MSVAHWRGLCVCCQSLPLFPYKPAVRDLPYRKVQQLFAKHMKVAGQKTLNPYFVSSVFSSVLVHMSGYQ